MSYYTNKYLEKTAKKLVVVLVNSILKIVAKIKIKAIVVLLIIDPRFGIPVFNTNNLTLSLKYIPYIDYLIYFQKNKGNIKVLINFDNKVNIITLVYAKKLGLQN